MEVGNTTLYALVLLIINGGALWIRELRKGKITNGNGKALEEIKEKIDCMDKNVGETKGKIIEVKTVVNEQKTQCKRTVDRFDKAITNQGNRLLDLAGRKR